MIPLGDLAAQFALGSELLMSVVTPRMNTTIHGRLEGGLLYTSAYIARIKAQVWIIQATQAPCTHALSILSVSVMCTGTMLCCCSFHLPQPSCRNTVLGVAVTVQIFGDSMLPVGTYACNIYCWSALSSDRQCSAVLRCAVLCRSMFRLFWMLEQGSCSRASQARQISSCN